MQAFKNKWGIIAHSSDSEKQKEEADLFVPKGSEPLTQRQLNLYYYFLFTRNILGPMQAQDVLEIGCGRGTISLYLAKYLGLSTHLLDDSEDAIVVAKDLFSKYGKEAKFYVKDALKTDFDEAQFDAVVSIGLAEHLDTVDELFSEQYRILKPGGVMISLNIPKKFSIQFLNTGMRFAKKIIGSYREKTAKDYYRNTLSPREYADAAQRVGFRDIEITHVAPFPLYTPIKLTTDIFITSINKKILDVRSAFMVYPYKTNKLLSQAHFLVAYKPS
jgi:ubiquinone/menaquinone biosynthesis C-methylase UbiE